MICVFHPLAEAELLDAIAFYESRRPGIGANSESLMSSVIPAKAGIQEDACQRGERPCARGRAQHLASRLHGSDELI